MARSPVMAAVATLLAHAPIDERHRAPRLYSEAQIAREVYGCARPTRRQSLEVRRAVAALMASGEIIGELDPEWPADDGGRRRAGTRLGRLLALDPGPAAFTRPMTAAEREDRARFVRTSAAELRERFGGVRRPVDGRYWARTSDLRLVEAALSQLS